MYSYLKNASVSVFCYTSVRVTSGHIFTEREGNNGILIHLLVISCDNTAVKYRVFIRITYITVVVLVLKFSSRIFFFWTFFFVLLIITYTVYPKKYAHGFSFAVLCCGYTLTDFPISIRLTLLALWQSNDCPSASKATLMNMDKYFIWIHY